MALDALNNIVDNNAPVLGSPLVYLTTANQKLGHDLAQFFTDHDLDDDGKTLDYRVIALQDADGNTPRGDVLVLQGTTLTFDPNGSYDRFGNRRNVEPVGHSYCNRQPRCIG
jgi:hypothetical protein